ncbi:MAG: hypothetical protein ACRDQW_16900, partial [Haloechinothrix sp.]
MALRAEDVSAPAIWPPGWSEPATGRGNRAVEICTVAFFLILYTNLAVVLTQVHGVPETVASGFVLLL